LPEAIVARGRGHRRIARRRDRGAVLHQGDGGGDEHEGTDENERDEGVAVQARRARRRAEVKSVGPSARVSAHVIG
jgi:hypothetical protein